MARVRSKICGVTRPQDAASACLHGADAIGIVLHPPSVRNVSIEAARRIIATVGPFVTPVGVFVDSSPQEVLDTAATLGLRTVQLNGTESPDEVAELAGLVVLKAIRVMRGGLIDQPQPWRRAVQSGELRNLIGLVMEPGHAEVPGGSGMPNDWDEIVAARSSGALDGMPPIIAAGGLTPQSVAEVIGRVRPWGVDVSSGVESEKGVKSEQKIEAFLAETARASAGHAA